MRARAYRVKVSVFLLIIILASTSGESFAKTSKPTLAQIEAAKKVEALKRSSAKAASGELQKAKRTLAQLSAIAEEAEEKYAKARRELAVAVVESNSASQYANDTSQVVDATRREIGKLATNAYMNGSGLTDLESILSAQGPQDLVERLSILENLGTYNSTALERYKIAETSAKVAQRAANAARRNQEIATIKVASAKKSAEDAKAQQQDEVNRLQAIEDELLKQLASAKKRRVTLEQIRQIALLESSRDKKASNTPGKSKVWGGSDAGGVTTVRSTPAQRLKAIEYTKKQVLARKPYVWGASGPDAFDCSGLVYAAYKYAGLGWPNWDRLNAALYYRYTKRVPLAEMQPGDLIFYSYDGKVNSIYHVSIYAGGGMTWDARSTRSGLRYGNIYDLGGVMPFAGRV
ncbi:MAG: C40 family peptidase [Actinobacteria bacterium]|nr:C40 family peptidase [Actinomycetota bacterium]